MSIEKIMDTLGQTKAFSMFHPRTKRCASSFRKVSATMLLLAGGRIPPWAVVQRVNPTTSATVSSRSSTDRFSLNFLMIFPLANGRTAPVSLPPTSVKLDTTVRRLLLVAADDSVETDLLEALKRSEVVFPSST